MVKVSVLYPNEEGKKFDLDYYLATHIPLVRKLLGAACTNVEVDQGIAGGTPGSKALTLPSGICSLITLKILCRHLGQLQMPSSVISPIILIRLPWFR